MFQIKLEFKTYVLLTHAKKKKRPSPGKNLFKIIMLKFCFYFFAEFWMNTLAQKRESEN